MWCVITVVERKQDTLPWLICTAPTMEEANLAYENEILEMTRAGAEIERELDYRAMHKSADAYFKRLNGSKVSVHMYEYD